MIDLDLRGDLIGWRERERKIFLCVIFDFVVLREETVVELTCDTVYRSTIRAINNTKAALLHDLKFQFFLSTVISEREREREMRETVVELTCDTMYRSTIRAIIQKHHYTIWKSSFTTLHTFFFNKYFNFFFPQSFQREREREREREIF